MFTTNADIESPANTTMYMSDCINDDSMAAVCHYLMMHYADQHSAPTTPSKKSYSLNKGLKKFGDLGKAAVSKELNQLYVLQTFTPIRASSLTPDQKKQTLLSLMFLTKKSNGEIKARACADGRPQHQHIAKEETALPTMNNDSLFTLTAIDAYKNRHIVTMDIWGAFLHANTKDFVVMHMTGTLAKLMVKTSPSLYRKFVIVDKSGCTILNVQLQKALYGMLKSALLFYQKLVADLTALGFTLNPYDPCITNKTINGTERTVLWHVDDLKYHISPSLSSKQSYPISKQFTATNSKKILAANTTTSVCVLIMAPKAKFKFPWTNPLPL